MNIYLVRHGLSEANVDKSLHGKIADHAIKLATEGILQAQKAGEFLNKHFKYQFPHNIEHIKCNKHIRMWVSPYQRTRQTAAEIFKNTEYSYKDGSKHNRITSQREHINLVEQQFGLFDGLSDDKMYNEIQQKYPDEYEHYKKCEDFGGKFWARMPLGESRFDVTLRVQQSFGTFWRDAEKHGIENIVVVAHGLSIRAFIMSWMHYSVEWFESEPNPPNCSIRLLQNNVDKGYIFEGFDKHKLK